MNKPKRILVVDDKHLDWMLAYAKQMYGTEEGTEYEGFTAVPDVRDDLRDWPETKWHPAEPRKYDAVVTDLLCPAENLVGCDAPWFAGGLLLALWCKESGVPCTIVTDLDHHSTLANPWCMIQRAAGLPEFVDNQKKS